MSLYHNNKTIHISSLTLRVLDLKKSAKFYNEVLGFEIIDKTKETIRMGYLNNEFLVLKQAKTKKEIKAAGLYHVAYLVPNRSSFANFIAYHLEHNREIISGASYHGVSEAIYLEDLDGNGIEVYVDLDPKEWEWENEQVKMVTKQLDLDNLFKELTVPTNKLPEGTRIGHLHLSVLDLKDSQEFYRILGFETVLQFRNAAFMSDNKYHHHLGMNTWNMKGALVHNHDQVDLDSFTITYPSEEAIKTVLLKLREKGYHYTQNKSKIEVLDVNNIKLILST